MLPVISELYEHTQIVPIVKELIWNCRNRQKEEIEESWEDVSELIASFCRMTASIDNAKGSRLWMCFQEACSYSFSGQSNQLKMADKLEELIPLLYDAVTVFGTIDTEDKGFRLVSSKSGYLILQRTNDGYQWHSSIDPMWEAFIQAKKIYSTRFKRFHIMGCGLGYLAYQLYCISGGSLDIVIFDRDETFVNLATDYGVLSYIPEDILRIEIIKDSKKLLKDYKGYEDENSKGTTGYYYYEDTMLELMNERADEVPAICQEINTRIAYGDMLERNFYRNRSNVSKTIADIKSESVKKNWLIVGAGPSFDERVDLIKSHADSHTIIAVGTIYKRMLQEGIVPDYVIVTDPQSRTFAQFDGVTEFRPTLLLNMLAAWEFAEFYRGDAYLLPGEGSYLTEDYCRMKGIKTMDLGSDVAIAALSVALYLGAKEVGFVGIDFAYPTGISHASGTMDEVEIDSAVAPMVRSVSGDMIPTSELFKVYLVELEEMIAKNRQVSYVNYSMGADIKGAKWKAVN
jgi:hypothetical protein